MKPQKNTHLAKKKNGMKQFLALLIALFLIAACKPDGESHQHDHDAESHQEHEQNHSAGHDANAHMNKQPFEELVANFEDSAREEWQRPNVVLAALQDLNGKSVADIGAGSGYFTFRLLDKAEEVIAIDIDQRFLDYIQTKADSMPSNLGAKLETRLSQPEDPKLDSAEVDVILIVNTYHHINNRVEYVKKLKQALKPGGRLVIVDFKKGELPHGPPDEMKLGEMAVQDELMSAGFRTVSSGKLLDYQYFLTAYN
ncbi:MAG: class I SAM-dependent methyltransferase [Bacteroidota bacterium]